MPGDDYTKTVTGAGYVAAITFTYDAEDGRVQAAGQVVNP